MISEINTKHKWTFQSVALNIHLRLIRWLTRGKDANHYQFLFYSSGGLHARVVKIRKFGGKASLTEKVYTSSKIETTSKQLFFIISNHWPGLRVTMAKCSPFPVKLKNCTLHSLQRTVPSILYKCSQHIVVQNQAR